LSPNSGFPDGWPGQLARQPFQFLMK